MSSQETIVDIQARFARVARGRAVLVKYEPGGFILAPDWKVGFNADTNAFEVFLKPGGCFEGAYRCLERFIEAKAEELDGIDSTPPGHVDFRRNMSYWILEKVYDQFRLDLEAAVGDRVSWLERVRPGEDVLGEIVIETRTLALTGLLAHLQHSDGEVRRAVLSPQTIDFLKNIGLDVFSEAG